MTPNEQGSAGFTLIEMLVALSLLSLLSLLMIATIPQLKAFQRLTTANDAEMELDSVAGFIAGQLASAQRLSLVRSGDQERIVFEGTPSSVSFVGLTRVGSNQFALKDINLGEVKGVLTVSEKARRLPQPQVHSYILSEQDLELSFSYCDRNPNAAPRCQEDWRSDRLPAFLKMDIKRVGVPTIRRETMIIFENAG